MNWMLAFAVSAMILVAAQEVSTTSDKHEVVSYAQMFEIPRLVLHPKHHHKLTPLELQQIQRIKRAIRLSRNRDKYAASWHYLNPAQQQRDLHAGDAFRRTEWSKVKGLYR